MKTRTTTRWLIGSLLSISLLLSTAAQQAPIQTSLLIANQSYNNTTVTEAAVQNITTTGNVTIGSNASVTFEAGQKIVLSPGFHATTTAGSTFRARIGLSTATLAQISAATGLPVGMTMDSNHNGIPDLVEAGLGLNPAADNSTNPKLQDLLRQYQYDKNNQLTGAPERGYQLDAEGNIINNQSQP